jgi:hypothetical protein
MFHDCLEQWSTALRAFNIIPTRHYVDTHADTTSTASNISFVSLCDMLFAWDMLVAWGGRVVVYKALLITKACTLHSPVLVLHDSLEQRGAALAHLGGRGRHADAQRRQVFPHLQRRESQDTGANAAAHERPILGVATEAIIRR